MKVDNYPCGPQKFPEWVRALITKFVNFKKYCSLHDIEYEIITVKQANLNFIAYLRKEGLGKLKLKIISFFINMYGKNYQGLLMKETKNSAFCAELIFTTKDGKLHPVGGKLEANESALDGFKREFEEETGYKLKDSQVTLEFTNLLQSDELDDDWYQSFFSIKNVDLEALKPSNEVKELKIVDKYALLNMDDSELSFASLAIKRHYLRSHEMIFENVR